MDRQGSELPCALKALEESEQDVGMCGDFQIPIQNEEKQAIQEVEKRPHDKGPRLAPAGKEAEGREKGGRRNSGNKPVPRPGAGRQSCDPQAKEEAKMCVHECQQCVGEGKASDPEEPVAADLRLPGRDRPLHVSTTVYQVFAPLMTLRLYVARLFAARLFAVGGAGSCF